MDNHFFITRFSPEGFALRQNDDGVLSVVQKEVIVHGNIPVKEQMGLSIELRSFGNCDAAAIFTALKEKKLVKIVIED